jgi:hypothetical protein
MQNDLVCDKCCCRYRVLMGSHVIEDWHSGELCPLFWLWIRLCRMSARFRGRHSQVVAMKSVSTGYLEHALSVDYVSVRNYLGSSPPRVRVKSSRANKYAKLASSNPAFAFIACARDVSRWDAKVIPCLN